MAAEKCPYCYRPIGTHSHDPILLLDGSPYKWSNDTTLILENDVASRIYKGIYQVSNIDVIELQNGLKLLEEEQGIIPITIFSPLNINGTFQITGYHIKEMRDSVEKLLVRFGKTKSDYFNYDEENNHIINPNGDKIEWTDPIIAATDLTNFQVNYIHIEDLRHYAYMILKETWDMKPTPLGIPPRITDQWLRVWNIITGDIGIMPTDPVHDSYLIPWRCDINHPYTGGNILNTNPIAVDNTIYGFYDPISGFGTPIGSPTVIESSGGSYIEIKKKDITDEYGNITENRYAEMHCLAKAFTYSAQNVPFFSLNYIPGTRTYFDEVPMTTDEGQAYISNEGANMLGQFLIPPKITKSLMFGMETRAEFVIGSYSANYASGTIGCEFGIELSFGLDGKFILTEVNRNQPIYGTYRITYLPRDRATPGITWYVYGGTVYCEEIRVLEDLVLEDITKVVTIKVDIWNNLCLHFIDNFYTEDPITKEKIPSLIYLTMMNLNAKTNLGLSFPYQGYYAIPRDALAKSIMDTWAVRYNILSVGSIAPTLSAVPPSIDMYGMDDIGLRPTIYPSIDFIEDRIVIAENPVEFTVVAPAPPKTATNPTPSVTITTSPLPLGATFNPVDLKFKWIPTPLQTGNYPLVFTSTTNLGYMINRPMNIMVMPKLF